MSIIWSVQISASFGFEIYKKKKLENSENRGCHGNGEVNQQIFYICVHHTIYVKNGQSFRKKNLFFSISEPNWKVSDFLRE